jgi:RNA recognition motif-containing protein
MRDSSGTSKGFGFVCFTDPTAAEKATSFMLRNEASAAADGEKIEESEAEAKSIKGVKLSDLYVREAKKKEHRVHELQMNNFKYKKSIMFFSLFVKNFPIGTSDEELKIYFSSACQGEVTKV